MGNKVDSAYKKMLSHVMEHGELRDNRTGTRTYSVFGYQCEYKIRYDAFPILTTKKVNFDAIVHELLWFLSGSQNTDYLKDNNVQIWDAWADDEGFVGPIYGAQWRGHGCGEDQIQGVIDSINADPMSRRHIVSAWNVSELHEMALPPCHMMFQFYVTNDGKLDCHLYQRSGDVFLGVPFNVTSYSLLTYMVAQQTGLQPGRLIHSFGDLHLYENHMAQALIQLERKPFKLPELNLVKADTINDYKRDNFVLNGYKHHSFLKGAVAV